MAIFKHPGQICTLKLSRSKFAKCRRTSSASNICKVSQNFINVEHLQSVTELHQPRTFAMCRRTSSTSKARALNLFYFVTRDTHNTKARADYGKSICVYHCVCHALRVPLHDLALIMASRVCRIIFFIHASPRACSFTSASIRVHY